MDRIAFATLLMGLIVGIQPVRVEISPDLHPAAIVYYLDGQPAGGAAAAPWEARIDFGRALRPHELVAAAVDEKGDRIASVSRIVNLPAPASRLDILVDRTPSGAPAGVRLVASSLRRATPVGLTLTLDGRPLALDAQAHAVLPRLDLAQTHVLAGTAEFGEDTVARSDLALGGAIADESGSRLTAVAIRVPAGSSVTAEGLKGRFRHGAEPIPVVAVERGDATVLVVRHPSSYRAASTFGRNKVGTSMHLDSGDRVALVWPVSSESRIGEQQTRLLELTPYFTQKDASFFWVLTQVSRQGETRGPFFYADAVSVAGLLAYQSGTRRAVVLVGVYPDDASQFRPGQVRTYLHDLGVPLHVWSYDRNLSPWGDTETLDAYRDFQRSVETLKQDLDTQRVAWIAGEWQPGQIELAPGPDGASLLP